MTTDTTTTTTDRRSLDSLLADIDALESEPEPAVSPSPTDDDLRRDGESADDFKARMIRELDELLAAERAAGVVDDEHWWDSATWRSPEPKPAPATPAHALIDPDLIHMILPKGGALRVSIGGRRIGTLNEAA